MVDKVEVKMGIIEKKKEVKVWEWIEMKVMENKKKE